MSAYGSPPSPDGSVEDDGGADGSVEDDGGADGSVEDDGGADGSVEDDGRTTLHLMDGKWRRLSSNRVYETEWLTVDVADVELPDKTKTEHHIVRVTSGEGAGMLAFDPTKGVLLIWRHRFIIDEWGWELPAGGVDAGESPKQAALREFTEETGWKANSAEPLIVTHRMPGVADDTGHVFFTKDTEFVGPGRDANEAADIAWLTVDQIKIAIQKNEVTDALTVTSLLYAMQFGLLNP